MCRRWGIRLGLSIHVTRFSQLAVHSVRFRGTDVDSSSRITVAGDKSFDNAEFVAGCPALAVNPHAAQNVGGRRGLRFPNLSIQV